MAGNNDFVQLLKRYGSFDQKIRFIWLKDAGLLFRRWWRDINYPFNSSGYSFEE